MGNKKMLYRSALLLQYRSIDQQSKQIDKEKRVEVCISLLNRHRTLGWVDLFVTMDGKCSAHDNVVRHKHWVNFDELPETQPKPDHHDRRKMLSFWWDVHAPIIWDSVPNGCKVDADIFYTQLEMMSEIVYNRRPKGGRILFLMKTAYCSLNPRSSLLAQFGLYQQGGSM
ncbi:unnamed protein product [Nippostrongylus brasiliensis]|uniref:DDE_Tnp_1_7 domain-containing protein n=1 Tax=Nippostrongylus brasiliensis TaxID=27835 RepID=A0A0N4Y4F4_NIPBR|nr:unnamed protein product [Nippostrongylus brasiliensis]